MKPLEQELKEKYPTYEDLHRACNNLPSIVADGCCGQKYTVIKVLIGQEPALKSSSGLTIPETCEPEHREALYGLNLETREVVQLPAFGLVYVAGSDDIVVIPSAAVMFTFHTKTLLEVLYPEDRDCHARGL